MQHKHKKITFNAPCILTFALICLIAQLLNVITNGASNTLVFSVYRTGRFSLMTLLRCVTHVFGHADWSHLMNNMLYLLILGPLLEEKYGSKTVCIVMLASALATGIANLLFFPRVMLLGASGIVFAMILLASITNAREGEIPLTFVLVALLYIGRQLFEAFFLADSISQTSHIIGGVIGSACGFLLVRNGAHGAPLRY